MVLFLATPRLSTCCAGWIATGQATVARHVIMVCQGLVRTLAAEATRRSLARIAAPRLEVSALLPVDREGGQGLALLAQVALVQLMFEVNSWFGFTLQTNRFM